VDVQVLIRNQAKISEAQEKFAGAQVSALQQVKNLSLKGLIVAAPMSGLEFKEWMTAQNIQTNLILDLRDTASSDPLDFAASEVVKLQDLFKEIERTKVELSSRISAAKENIQHLAQKRGDTAFVRPFGWDDLCA
jgi:hypothetical protein